MKFIDVLLRIEKLNDIKKFNIRDFDSDFNLDIENLKSDNQLEFEFFFPHSNILPRNPKLIISDDFFTLKINHYEILNGKKLLSQKVKPYNFENDNFTEKGEFYYRLFSPISDYLYLHNLFNDSSIKFYEININDQLFIISIKKSEFRNYLVIESVNKINFSNFKHITNSVIITLGYLNGDFIKDEEIFFQTEDKSWININGFFYRKINKSKKFFKPITSNPKEYSNFINDKSYDYDSKTSCLDLKIFENLVSKVYENNNFFSALSLTFEASNISSLIKPSILFVVLEILCQEINKTNKEFVQKQLIIEDCKRVLDKYLREIDVNDFNILSEGISNLNTNLVSNNINFERAFKSLKINLNNIDRELLKKRDKFFHGKIISDDFYFIDEDGYGSLLTEYYSITQRLFTLISKLILKSVGYSGYIINHQKLREQQSNKKINEAYFIKI